MLTGVEVAQSKYADTSYVVLAGALMDQVTVAYSMTSDAELQPVVPTELRQPKTVETLVELPGKECSNRSKVHAAVLEGEVSSAKLVPALV